MEKDTNLMEMPSNVEINLKETTNAASEATSCGVGECRPNIFQKFAKIGVFTGTLSVPLLLTSTLSTYVNSQITTLEKQFGLNSSQTGILMAANDIGYVTVAMFISYFAPRVHIPRFLAVLAALFGVSGIICSLPHFLYGVESIGDSQLINSSLTKKNVIGQLCSGTTQSDVCALDESGSSKPRAHATSALIIIGIGMFLQGVSKAPRHPFTVTYLEDNVVRTKTGYYLGILITIGIMGPVFSFALGGFFTRIYVTLEATSLYPRHPKWVGAWWLGYIVFGVAALFTSFPLFFFPRKLPDAPTTREKNDHVSKGNFTKEVKSYIRVLGNILTNPIFMLLMASSVTVIFSVAGAQSFLPKYIENQFGLEAWKANLIIAGLSLSTACVGTFVGGWWSKRLKMGPLLALKWNCVLYFLVVIFFGLGFVFGCEQPELVNKPGLSEADCILNCSCSNNEYFPICGSDNRNYFSPCHAGCSFYESGTYINCTCIPGGEAWAGSCYYDCPYLIPYFVALGGCFFASTVSIVPKIIAEIRCVTEEEKPLSVGVMAAMVSLLGWMLAPMVFGRIIDTSCLMWDSDCSQNGACVLYDLADFRVKLHGLYLGGRVLAFLFAVMALMVALKNKRLHPKTQEMAMKDSVDTNALVAE